MVAKLFLFHKLIRFTEKTELIVHFSASWEYCMGNDLILIEDYKINYKDQYFSQNLVVQSLLYRDWFILPSFPSGFSSIYNSKALFILETNRGLYFGFKDLKYDSKLHISVPLGMLYFYFSLQLS
jgi:hypothetical protein